MYRTWKCHTRPVTLTVGIEQLGRVSIVRLLTILLWLVAFGGLAQAHFSEDLRTRTIVVTEEAGSLRIYLQTPAPLVFADLIAASQSSGERLESPYLYLESTGLGPRYRLSVEQLAKDETTLKSRLQDFMVWAQDGRTLMAQTVRFRIAGRMQHGDFDTLDAARDELAKPGARIDPVFGDAVIEAELVLRDVDPARTFTVGTGFPVLSLGPNLTIENVVVDARVSPAFSFARLGQLETPIRVDGSRFNAALEFTWQGILHIVEGPDHVLLVICIALSAGLTMRLFWMVTAFTLGHSVTLIVTFLGGAPAWPWFIPVVEVAIAASVLYASIVALFRQSGSPWVFVLIGLLHGLGFSFVLGDILGRDSPNLVVSLAAFNVGIEIGQIALLALTLSLVFLLSRISLATVRPARIAVLCGIALVSSWWIFERLSAVQV